MKKPRCPSRFSPGTAPAEHPSPGTSGEAEPPPRCTSSEHGMQEGSRQAGARGGRGGRVTAHPPSASAGAGTRWSARWAQHVAPTHPAAGALVPRRHLKIKVWGENPPAESWGAEGSEPTTRHRTHCHREMVWLPLCCNSWLCSIRTPRLGVLPEDWGPCRLLGAFPAQPSPVLDAVLPGWKQRGRGCPRSKYKGIYFMGTRERQHLVCVGLFPVTGLYIQSFGRGRGGQRVPLGPPSTGVGGCQRGPPLCPRAVGARAPGPRASVS